MKRLLDAIDDQIQPGTLTRVAIYAAAILILIGYAPASREIDGLTIIFVIIGLSGAWQGYVVWQRRRRQRGLELIGTTEEFEG